MLAIDAALAPAFLHLTYPSLRPALLRARGDGPVLAFGEEEGGAPAGLALGQLSGDTFQVLSLYTVKEHRSRGIATRLLGALEQAARRLGARRLEGTYMSGRAAEAPLGRILDRQGWTAPQQRLMFLRAQARPLAEAPRWIRQCQPPAGMSIFHWDELDPYAEALLRARHAEAPWVAPELDPFMVFPGDPPFYPVNSLGLRHGDEVVGWIITHRIAHDTVRYSQWCVHPSLRRGSAAPALLAEAIRQQLARSDAPNMLFGVKPGNRAMSRFIARHLAGCVGEPYYSMGRSRELAA